MLRVRTARTDDAAALAPRLRAADLREIEGATGESPGSVLDAGLSESDPCFAIVDERDAPVALFGVVPDAAAPDVGLIWLLAADELERHGLSFVRECGEWVAELQLRYRVLWNWVDARNRIHVRWLIWCGFELLERVDDHGSGALPFYLFQKVRGQQHDVMINRWRRRRPAR